ncbi:MAG: hypothetical protein AB7N99_08875 [Simkaniaceae bacterium]
METHLYLINPKTHEIAAKYHEYENGSKTVEVLDRWLLQGLSSVGIAVPGGFANGKHYIYPTDEQALFAKAFKEEYFAHGLTQKGYYWVKQEDYTGPEGEIQKALDYVLRAIKSK